MFRPNGRNTMGPSSQIEDFQLTELGRISSSTRTYKTWATSEFRPHNMPPSGNFSTAFTHQDLLILSFDLLVSDPYHYVVL